MTRSAFEIGSAAITPRSARPRVLFLAFYFPPAQSSACVRTWNMAKYLARLGWEVTVVTPDPYVWRNADIAERVTLELREEGIARISTGLKWRCLSPDHLRCWNDGFGWVLGGLCRNVARRMGIDRAFGWTKEVMRACSGLTRDDVDVILATGDPFSAFMLAKRLSDKLQRPYILDYRDPWPTHDETVPFRRLAVRRLEQDLIAGAKSVIAISGSLLRCSPEIDGKLHVVTNGFDPEEMARVRAKAFGHFAIVYAGTFSPPKRTLAPLLAALKRLLEKPVSESVKWLFHYYGPQGDYVHDEAKHFGLTERLVVHGRVTRAEALSAIRGAGVTIVITSVLEEKAVADRGIVTGKLFDALGLRVPVLLIGPSQSDAEAIINTSGLVHLVSASNTDGIAGFLEAVLSGESPKEQNPEAYAWPHLIQKLDAILCQAMSLAGDTSTI